MSLSPWLVHILSSIEEGAYIVDEKRIILFWNPAAEKITGFSANEVVGTSCKDNILRHVNSEGTNLCENGCPLLRILFQKTPFVEDDVFLHHKNGYRLAVHIKGIPLDATLVSPNDDQKTYALELFSPLWKGFFVNTDDLIRLALQDPLTETLNRRGIETLFPNRLSEMLFFKKSIGVLFIDLDNFKQINGTYGHNMGDLVLQSTSQTIKQTLRPYDLFSRWGGEEFVIILFTDQEATIPFIAERCRILINKQFFTIDTTTFTVSASIGATKMNPGETLEEAILRADHLMYQAKRQGKNTCVSDI